MEYAVSIIINLVIFSYYYGEKLYLKNKLKKFYKMAPTTTDVKQDVKDLTVIVNKFMLSTVQRLTRIETIIWILFSGNSVATLALFLFNFFKS